MYDTDIEVRNLIDWICVSEQIKTNNNAIRNLTGEYKEIEPDCREGVWEQLERMKELCSIACGAKFLFTSANHAMPSLSTYPFPIFFEEWGLAVKEIINAWDNKDDIVIGNDAWIGFEAVILSGVKIGDGAIIGTWAVVAKDVAPYTDCWRYSCKTDTKTGFGRCDF